MHPSWKFAITLATLLLVVEVLYIWSWSPKHESQHDKDVANAMDCKRLGGYYLVMDNVCLSSYSILKEYKK